MKNKVIKASAIGLVCILFAMSGCTSAGVFPSAQITSVELTKGNYKIVTTSITGEASAGYIIGISMGFGLFQQTYGIIPLSKDRQLYKLAVQDLWKNFEARFGTAVGKKYALINIRYDSEALNLLVYTKPKVTIVADVIEFID